MANILIQINTFKFNYLYSNLLEIFIINYKISLFFLPDFILLKN